MKANQFPSAQANTSQVCYSPSQMYYSYPSTFWSSLSVPSSWNWEWRKKILRQRFGRRREKCFLVSGVLKFSMCQSKNYWLPLMWPSSVGLKVFFSGCGFEFLWFFSRQRWKLFPSATHAHPRKFGNHVTVHRPPADRPSAPQGHQSLLSHFLATVVLEPRRKLIARECCDQLAAVKTRYPLTSITWPYRRLRCRPIEVEYFFKVIRWQVTGFQMIEGSSLVFKDLYEICWVYVTMVALRFWFQLTMDAKIQPVI